MAKSHPIAQAVPPIPSGVGRHDVMRQLPLSKLHLDPQNPRLPEHVQGRSERELLDHLYHYFDLEEIATPMGLNGYFDEEPMVAVPIDLPSDLIPGPGQTPSADYFEFLDSAIFTVVEGNRRLATARILTDEALRGRLKARSWPTISDAVRQDLEVIPVIIYPTRTEVLPYLGVRHITGNRKWDSYAKARYIAGMLAGGRIISQIEDEVGDRGQNVLKNAIAYNLLAQAKNDFEYDISQAKEKFSLLLLAIGQKSVKHYLGWVTQSSRGPKSLPLAEISLDDPVDEDCAENLNDLLSFIFGDGDKKPVINESRDITDYLSHVLASPEAVECLKTTRDLQLAYELTDGEEAMLKRALVAANRKLESVNGMAHRHTNNIELLGAANRALETAGEVVKKLRTTT